VEARYANSRKVFNWAIVALRLALKNYDCISRCTTNGGGDAIAEEWTCTSLRVIFQKIQWINPTKSTNIPHNFKKRFFLLEEICQRAISEKIPCSTKHNLPKEEFYFPQSSASGTFLYCRNVPKALVLDVSTAKLAQQNITKIDVSLFRKLVFYLQLYKFVAFKIKNRSPQIRSMFPWDERLKQYSSTRALRILLIHIITLPGYQLTTEKIEELRLFPLLLQILFSRNAQCFYRE